MIKSFSPSLIIGLGGTGQWVATYLKAELLQTSGGNMPPAVRLLVFDTARKMTVRLKSAGSIRSVSSQVGVELEDPGEYVYLGETISDYVQEVNRGMHPHVATWFQAETHAKKILARSDFRWGQSAASFRQLGRLCFFQDVRSLTRSKIHTLLKQAIERIRDSTGSESLNIFLIGSLVGSSGSGMFIDVAYLARQLAETDFSVTLRAYLLLPESFLDLADAESLRGMHCRAYAALRELRRLSRVSQVGHPFHYHDRGEDPIWRGELETPLFDLVYLLDGRRAELALCDVPLEHGLAPTLADAIRTMIDPGSSQVGQHKVNVSAVLQDRKRLGELPPETFAVGSLGAYTIALPIQQLVEGWACRLGIELLDTLLCPECDTRTGLPVRLLPDANREAAGRRGRDEANEFLNRTRVSNPRAADQTVDLTQWPSIVARMSASNASDGHATVAAFGHWTSNKWRQAFEPLGEDDESAGLRRQMRQTFQSGLIDSGSKISKRIPITREMRVESVERIVQQVRDFKDNNLGAENSTTGQRAGGRCRKVLQQCAQFHLRRFERAFNIQVLMLLQGQSEADPRNAKGGKLGYVYDFMQALTDTLDQAQQTLTVVQRGHTVHPQQRLDGLTLARHWRREMEREAKSAVGLLARLGIGANTTRNRYLEAEQKLIDMLRSEVMDQVLTETLARMLRYVQGMKAQVEKWMRALALDRDGIYAVLLNRQRQVKDELTELEKIQTRWTIRDHDYEEERYQSQARSPSRDWVANLLTNLAWTVKESETGPRLELGWRSSRDGEIESWLHSIPAHSNADSFLKRCRHAFDDARSTESVMGYLMEAYPDPLNLANLVHKRSGVLLGHQAHNPLRANYLRIAPVRTAAEGEYLDAWMQRLSQFSSQSAGPGGGTQRFAYIVNSQSRFLCSLLHTEELVPFETLDATGPSVQEEYGQYRRELYIGDLDRRMLHVLPAEVNAVYFEDRLEMLDQPRRLLADEVVSQLERLDRLRLFLLGYICGLIVKDVRDEPGNVHTVWVLTLPADYGDDKDRGEAEQWQLTPAGRTGQLLEALTTFSFLGQDQARPSVYFHPIPYERVQQAVERLLDADARRRVEAGTAGQRLEHANRRNLIAALRGQAHEVASLAAARIDRLAEAQDVLYSELAELQAVTRGQEARLAADLYSVFVLTLQKERAEMEKVIGEQIVIVTGPTKSKSWRRGRR